MQQEIPMQCTHTHLEEGEVIDFANDEIITVLMCVDCGEIIN